MSFERRKVRLGRVVSDKMDKTVVVQVEWRHIHRLYKKSVKRNSRFKAHDESNLCRVGDLIRIVESRPLSRTKRWRVAEILAHEEIAEVQPEDIGTDELAPAVNDVGATAESETRAGGADEQAEVETEASVVATLEETDGEAVEQTQVPSAAPREEVTPEGEQVEAEIPVGVAQEDVADEAQAQACDVQKEPTADAARQETEEAMEGDAETGSPGPSTEEQASSETASGKREEEHPRQ